MQEIKPCPCCGEDQDAWYSEIDERWYGLYNGPQSSCTYGVTCYTCGLRNEVGLPYSSRKSMKKLKDAALKEAIKRWNKRVGEEK